ncbi:hypothetical protein BC830DRAFT_1170431 [Chytriomyces sp. MP71]|nr:hypothetical protein BC830DRAFT_1170431 [Chytriomyces sp. MP71]
MRRSQLVLVILGVFGSAPFALLILMNLGRTGLSPFAQTYFADFGRLPPPGFDDWIRFANQRGCDAGLANHVAPLFAHPGAASVRANGTRVSETKWTAVVRWDPFVAEASRLARLPNTTHNDLKHSFHEAFEAVIPLVAGAIKHTVLIPINQKPFPRSLPADLGSRNYLDWSDLRDRSSCVRNKYPAEVAFLFNDYIDVYEASDSVMPLLSTSTMDCFADIPFPSIEDMRLLKNQTLLEGIEPVPWSDKKNTLYWARQNASAKISHDSQEHRLILWQQNYTASLSSKKANLPTLPSSTKLLDIDLDFSSASSSASTSSFPTTHKYILLTHAEAVSNPLLLHATLASASVLLLATPVRTYMSARLTPMLHYIPVKPDFADLPDRIAWLARHDETASAIAENGHAFWREEVGTLEYAECYAGLVLLEWARLNYTDPNQGSNQ